MLSVGPDCAEVAKDARLLQKDADRIVADVHYIADTAGGNSLQHC